MHLTPERLEALYADASLEMGPVMRRISEALAAGDCDAIDRLACALTVSGEARPYRVAVCGDDAGSVLATCAREAISRVDAGDGFDPEPKTFWVPVDVVAVFDPDDAASALVAVHPPEPACRTPGEHSWRGLWMQPHGGGAMGEDYCRACGVRKVWDSWATDPVTGTQGLESVRYEGPDAETLARVMRERAEWRDPDPEAFHTVFGAYPWAIEADNVAALIDVRAPDRVDALLSLVESDSPPVPAIVTILRARLEALEAAGEASEEAIAAALGCELACFGEFDARELGIESLTDMARVIRAATEQREGLAGCGQSAE